MNCCVARFDPLARTAIHGYFYIEFSVTRKKGRNERSKKEKREKIHMTASVRGLRHSCLFSRWSYYQIKRNLILNKFTVDYIVCIQRYILYKFAFFEGQLKRRINQMLKKFLISITQQCNKSMSYKFRNFYNIDRQIFDNLCRIVRYSLYTLIRDLELLIHFVKYNYL